MGGSDPPLGMVLHVLGGVRPPPQDDAAWVGEKRLIFSIVSNVLMTFLQRTKKFLINSRVPKENMTVFMGSEGVLRGVPRGPEGVIFGRTPPPGWCCMSLGGSDPPPRLVLHVLGGVSPPPMMLHASRKSLRHFHRFRGVMRLLPGQQEKFTAPEEIWTVFMAFSGDFRGVFTYFRGW